MNNLSHPDRRVGVLIHHVEDQRIGDTAVLVRRMTTEVNFEFSAHVGSTGANQCRSINTRSSVIVPNISTVSWLTGEQPRVGRTWIVRVIEVLIHLRLYGRSWLGCVQGIERSSNVGWRGASARDDGMRTIGLGNARGESWLCGD